MELQKTLTPGEALERVLRSYQTYYNIKTEAVEPPFAAEAIFGSHNEQYFLIKKAKVADIDTNETVYFATEESLSKDRLLELDSIAWERGTANVQPSSNHRNSDVVLIILSSQKRITSFTASTVARGPGASVGICHFSRHLP